MIYKCITTDINHIQTYELWYINSNILIIYIFFFPSSIAPQVISKLFAQLLNLLYNYWHQPKKPRFNSNSKHSICGKAAFSTWSPAPPPPSNLHRPPSYGVLRSLSMHTSFFVTSSPRTLNGCWTFLLRNLRRILKRQPWFSYCLLPSFLRAQLLG